MNEFWVWVVTLLIAGGCSYHFASEIPIGIWVACLAVRFGGPVIIHLGD